jgi:hypothetical protein
LAVAPRELVCRKNMGYEVVASVGGATGVIRAQ